MRIRPCGDRAFLAELDSLDAVLALHAALATRRPAGVVDLVPAARTLLVRATDPDAAAAARALVATLDLTAAPQRDDALVEIRVHYDGADLADVAQATGLSVDAVVAAHTGQVWTAAFGGFAPGFTYCVGENDSLTVPRRATPRTSVPAGAVGLAGEFSAVYPRATPGGWQLIGTSPDVLWDAARTPPALVAPGNRVRYVAAREAVTLRPTPAEKAAARPVPADQGLEILTTGAQALVQDRGRPGFADLGVSASGAADRASAAAANTLVGNPPDAALIECVADPSSDALAVRARETLLVAVTGASVRLTLTGPATCAEPPADTPLVLLAGHTLTLGEADAGLRAYLAVRGGLAAGRVLGSAATDLLSGEGPAPLRPGDVLATGRTTGLAAVPLARHATPSLPRHLDARVHLGPRDDWFTPDALTSFLAQRWTVTPRSNRIGMRLAGEPLTRVVTGELRSEGVVAGAVQVPADGQPVVFGPDHPVTGGYPVIAVVADADIDRLAQLPPGSTVRFVRAD